MATFNVFKDLIQPLGEELQRNPTFAGVNIFYDREASHIIPREITPAINYFLEAPWNDVARGSGSFSLQSRILNTTLGFGIWIYGGENDAEADAHLFEISGNLFDFFRARRDFNRVKGIVIGDEIEWDYDYQGGETGLFLSTQKLSVPFQFIAAC